MIGRTVSHYRIVAALGRGGTSIVYKARDTRLGRFVALKFLLEEYCSSREFLEQFEQEARTASALNHPAICTIHDVGRHRNRPFIVMECLEGETLRDKMRWHGLTVKEAVAYGIHFADALSQIHAAGVVHRDISPANLFITVDGHVKLLDFGIAKLVTPDGRPAAQHRCSKTGGLTLTGTICYMSPEQALCRNVDPRSDIFSAGVVLYEMFAGRRPFAGSNIACVIQRIISGTPDSLQGIAPKVSGPVKAVVNRCLEKSPAKRYQTAQELREDLKAAAIVAPLDTKYPTKPAVAPTLDETECMDLSETVCAPGDVHHSV